MATRKRKLVERVSDRLEEATGHSVVSRDRLDLLEAWAVDYRALAKDVEEIGWSMFDYANGGPQELRRDRRLRIVQQARYVWMSDPQAGAAVELMNDFCFGRGVPEPRCKDKKVQEVVSDAWHDPDNQEVLTSLEAQLALGTDLALQPLDPDTEIRMADGSRKRLGDVQAGECVLTHSGESGRVADNIDAGVPAALRADDGRAPTRCRRGFAPVHNRPSRLATPRRARDR